jgi:uncharacterized membrane protein
MDTFPKPVSIILGAVLVLAVLGLLPLLLPTGERPPDEEWKGVFYSNRDNRAVLVPKRYGIGHTLNFGNPWAWVVLAFILLAIAAPIALSVMSFRQLPAKH